MGSVFQRKCNNGFTLHCCRTAKYCTLLLTINSIKYYECVCVCLALVTRHANRIFILPYYCIFICGLYGCTVFQHYLINVTIFGGGELLNVKRVLRFFSTTYVWNISPSENNSWRYHKCTQVFMWNTCYSCQILMKLEFSRHVFENFSNVKFHENLYSGRHPVSCGHTDRYRDRHGEVDNYNFPNAS